MGKMAAAFANAGIDAGVALLDGGSGEFRDSVDAEVATVQLSNPASAGAASAGQVTFDTITKDDTATGGGPIDKLVLLDSVDADHVELSVGLASDDPAPEIEMDNLSPAAGVDVSLTSLTLSFPVDI